MNESEIRSSLRTARYGRTIHLYDVIDSTNTKAKLLAAGGAPDGTLVIAERQTAGKGRLGRNWESEPGVNLTFSLILRPQISPSRTGIIPLIAGIAVSQAVEDVTGRKPSCKWPNDILMEGRKICGILTESLVEGSSLLALIVGIGINVNQKEFPAEIRETAGSLLRVTGTPVPRVSLLSAVLYRLENLSAFFTPDRHAEFLKTYSEYGPRAGTRVRLRHSSGTASGVTAGIDDSGGLILRDPRGTETTWYAGDVTILPEDTPS